jgi:hypothetical protein
MLNGARAGILLVIGVLVAIEKSGASILVEHIQVLINSTLGK